MSDRDTCPHTNSERVDSYMDETPDGHTIHVEERRCQACGANTTRARTATSHR